MDIEEMRYELAEYYETAGFADVYNKVLVNKSDAEIIELYKDAFGSK